MNGVRQHWTVFLGDQRGDVLMEYVILLVCIITPLIGAGALFDPWGDYTGNFGTLGSAFQQWYQQLVAGISLPIP